MEPTSPPSPPDDVFDSREAAQEAVQQWAKKHSFAVMFNRLRKNIKGEYYKQWIECTKHGIFKAKGHGIRETTSRMEDCKWQAQLF